MSDIKKLVEERLERYAVDCGDNSCRFAPKKGGMRTNGGCRCLSTRSFMQLQPIKKLAVAQSQLIGELVKEIERLQGQIDAQK